MSNVIELPIRSSLTEEEIDALVQRGANFDDIFAAVRARELANENVEA